MGNIGKSAYLKGILLWSLALLAAACSPKETPTAASCGQRVSSVYIGPSEPTYCTTPISYSSPQVITGTATYESRPYTTLNGLGAIGAAQTIKYAEVAVLDKNGATVQCGETNGSGQFSLDVPSSSDPYTVRVFSRANNANLKVSVMNCPEENVPYSVSGSVTADGTQSALTITATAENTGSLLGGAFNIFDQVLKANQFFRTNVNVGFVADKVSIYWAKGFNPNAYFGSVQSGLSFYIPSYRRLFILGGINGDIYNSDTDHFDNSIILHEYGHFLEDVYTDTDSPGGSHSANGLVDPRLAWGEGWGNFIQAAITNDPYYRDTEGTPSTTPISSTSKYIFRVSIENATVFDGDTLNTFTCTLGNSSSGCDLPQNDSEGIFREFAVTRSLWDIFDSTAAGNNTASDETVQNEFDEIWTALTSSQGFLNPNAAFRNIGLLFEMQDAMSSVDLSSIHTLHEQQGGSLEYARYIGNVGTCGKVYNLDPIDNFPIDTGTFATSHLLKNNNFYYYKHPGGAFSLTLKALTVDVGSDGYLTEREPDLDLYLYNVSGRIGNSSDIIARSDNYWDNNANTEQTESISLANLAAGNYLIQTKIFTGRYLIDTTSSTNNCIGSGATQVCENNGAPRYNYIPSGDNVTYELELNGADLCPAALP